MSCRPFGAVDYKGGMTPLDRSFCPCCGSPLFRMEMSLNRCRGFYVACPECVTSRFETTECGNFGLAEFWRRFLGSRLVTAIFAELYEARRIEIGSSFKMMQYYFFSDQIRIAELEMLIATIYDRFAWPIEHDLYRLATKEERHVAATAERILAEKAKAEKTKRQLEKAKKDLRKARALVAELQAKLDGKG